MNSQLRIHYGGLFDLKKFWQNTLLRGTCWRILPPRTWRVRTDIRLDWAENLLSRGTASIEFIAGATGFNDRFHFSKTFKQKTGVSPAAYREQNKINRQEA